MLISTDVTGKRGSIFECDRCKKKIHTISESKYKLVVYKTARGYKKVMSWDLCERCYKALCRGIEKGVNKNGNSKEM